MADLQMPPARAYGWELKPTSSTFFEINRRENGQFSVVLNHALLRGVTADMIYWWFLNFPNLKVRLIDIPGYEDKIVSAYLLWHPSDHVDAQLKGALGLGGTSQVGAKIHIREAMQYLKHGLRFPVDAAMTIFYCADDGWAMGKKLPLLGPAMCLRIHYRDVEEDGKHIGVHYHYEIVVGLSGGDPLSRFINGKLTGHYPPEFFEAWHLHNTIEVGVFENFLPALYAQRETPEALEFSRDMDAAPGSPADQKGFDPALFKRRVEGYRAAQDPFEFQAFEAASFL
ncbi:MAG: hypothetical protein AAGC81_11405 [Pseudomonadota bacterium]